MEIIARLPTKLRTGQPTNFGALIGNDAIALTTRQQRVVPLLVLILPQKPENLRVTQIVAVNKLDKIYYIYTLRNTQKLSSYLPHTLTIAKHAYNTTKREFLAIVWPYYC